MIDHLVEHAERLVADGRYEQARDQYTQICRLAPHRAPYWLRLAELQYDLEQFQACLAPLEYALRLEPRNSAALRLATAALLETGRYESTLQRADQLLALDSNNLVALRNKGTALLRLEQYPEALATFNQALVLEPDEAAIHASRGSALLGLGRPGEALAAFDQALVRRPNYGIALINRSAALRALHRPTEALAAADMALTIHPDGSAALLNRVAALIDLERYEEALTLIDQMLARQPTQLKALINRSLALLGLARYDEALAVIRALHAQGSSVVNAVLTAGDVLLRHGRPEQAAVWIDQGLAWYPDHSELLQGRIAILLAQEHYPAALAMAEQLLTVASPNQIAAQLTAAAAFNANGRFQEALALLDALPPAAQEDWQFHAKRGEAFAGLDRFAEARTAFALADQQDSRAFRINSHDGLLTFRPADSCLPPVTPEYIRINFEWRRLNHGDWQDYENRVALIQRWVEDSLACGEPSPLLPFRALFLPLLPTLRLAIARREAERFNPLTWRLGDERCTVSATTAENTRLKIGYVSADFHEHPTAHLMRSLFRCHDRHGFEIYVYALRGDDRSAYYRQIRDDSDCFVDLSRLDNAGAIQRIRADGIQILIDLMAYTNYARPEIFAARPAPVQVNWLGFPGSSGADYLDYLLVDPWVLPADQAAFCTEQPVYLPECYQVNDRWQAIAETGIRRIDQSLPDSAFVFCCFNQAQKLEPVMFAVWMRILGQVPGSVLWLYVESMEARDRLRATAMDQGITGERLIFADRLPKDRHLERHRLADLFLDTRIYNAHTTASDALWAGLPVLTCIGETFPARVVASLLHAVGLPELVTHSLDEYERLAVRLATQPTLLATLRTKLADLRLRTPLFDTERFARHLERAFAMMWERHVQGLPPAPLQVPPRPVSDRVE